MSNFRVGQKVVCVSDDWNADFYEGEHRPIKGNVYTIREISNGRKIPVVLRFEELVNPKLYCGGTSECRYNANKFRPVAERKTDISIFKAMLNPSKQGVPA